MNQGMCTRCGGWELIRVALQGEKKVKEKLHNRNKQSRPFSEKNSGVTGKWPSNHLTPAS